MDLSFSRRFAAALLLAGAVMAPSSAQGDEPAVSALGGTNTYEQEGRASSFSGAAATFDVSGTVRDASGRVLSGATISVGTGSAPVTTRTGADGRWHLRLPPGGYVLRIAKAGYAQGSLSLGVSAELAGEDVTLALLYRHSEAVVVQAIRADSAVPVTKTDITHEEIERVNYGQELPFLLRQAPSMTYYSDSGIGAGYAYFSIRGIQQTRINMTLDGAPLNDPEESALYFANFGDFASAVGSIQIQRGVGASTVGAASYGGSVNFTSVDVPQERGLDGELGTGSFGSRRGALTLASGKLPGGFAFYARTSFRETDGFKDHSGVRQRAVYFGLSRQDERSLFKLSGFSGLERSQLAFLATEEKTLRADPDFNELAPEERDRFAQNFLQAQYTRFLSASSSVAGQVYYNDARGWFRICCDTAPSDELLEYSIDGYFAGAVASYHYAKGPLSFTGGAHTGLFTRDHAGRFARDRVPDVPGGFQAYTNTGRKREANAFGKLGYDLGAWHLYADAQLRWARFRYDGSLDLGSVSWTFFNPKIGARRTLTPSLSLYASVGKATREPARSDLLAGEDNASIPYDLGAVRPERVVDIELGAEYRRPGLTVAADLYSMEFRHEIALTGELSQIGLPVRRNVDRSYRRGVEVDLAYQIAPTFKILHSANLSRNRIKKWTQFYDVYDAAGAYAGSTSRNHQNVRPLLTPQIVTNLGAEWTPLKETSLMLTGRYVSRSQLDNTDSADFRTPAFFNLDAAASLSIGRWLKTGGDLRLRIQVNNVLDNRRLWTSGYSYLYSNRDAQGRDHFTGTPYYYPLATRSAFVTLQFHL